MTKRLISAILISAAIPMAALAQASPAAPTPADAKMTNQNNARGGLNDARPMGQSSMADRDNLFVTVPSSGAWRVSDLEGKSVYGSEGENIGEINDVLISQNGSVNAVVIGVGGFLGIGEKDVAVNMSALQLGRGDTLVEANAASRRSNTVSNETTASTNSGAATGTAPPVAGTTANNNNAAAREATDTQTAANTVQIGEDGLPDRIILNVSRQQLEDAPAFEDVRSEQK